MPVLLSPLPFCRGPMMQVVMKLNDASCLTKLQLKDIRIASNFVKIIQLINHSMV